MEAVVSHIGVQSRVQCKAGPDMLGPCQQRVNEHQYRKTNQGHVCEEAKAARGRLG